MALAQHPVADILLRLLAAAGLGALLGLERQIHGHWAGLRTHMMVALGAAIFVTTGEELARAQTAPGLLPVTVAEISRVIQGVAAGIGFLGAGTILKLSDRLEIRGLTTASTIWMAAAVGTAAGCALYRLALIGTLISLVVLGVLLPLERRFEKKSASNGEHVKL